MTLLLARSSLRLTRHEKIFPLAKTQSFRVLLTPLTYIHVGQDRKGFSWRSLRLCELMLKIAQEFPEYKPGADKIGLVDVSSGAYCGAGYQDIQTRVPWIEITKADLEWRPAVSLQDALRNIFAAYRGEVGTVRALLDD